MASFAIWRGTPAVAKRTLPPPVTVLTPVLSRLFPVANISLVPPLTRASPVLRAVPVIWMALAGRLVIMFTPSVATVLSPEVPAEMTVPGADTMFPGTDLTKPLPEVTALSAKLVTAEGVLVRTLAPALRALPVTLKAVKGTWPTVLIAELPRLATWPGVWLITLTVLAGAVLMPLAPKLVKVLKVLGTELMVSTVRSDTVLTVFGTMSTPLTAASETTLTASGTEWTSCWPVWKAVLPVLRTKLNGVRRTS